MSEIAKYPLCGKEPIIGPHSGFIYHCGMKADGANAEQSIVRWNQYAAAMELAKARVAVVTYPLRDERQIDPWREFSQAEQCVLEVFK